jgi:carbonic anhydrase
MKKILIYFSLITFLFVGCQQQEQVQPSTDILTKEEQAALTPDQVIAELKAGNERFLAGEMTLQDNNSKLLATSKGQYPKAVILSCVDSRVPVETIFDEGIGDIFVGRVAGNIEDEDMLGSIEYGTAVAGSKLVLVLGHTQCGAVKGAVDIAKVSELGMENLNSLLVNIAPAVDSVLMEGEERTSKNHELVDRAVEKNVLLTIKRMREKSPTLAKLETEGKIKIVGAVYDLSTGQVNWL